MPGRKPKPTALKLVQGNPGRRPLNKKEPKPPATMPPKPKHLSGFASEAWDRIAPELHRAGLLSKIDGAGLELLVCAYDDWRAANALVVAEGLTYECETAGGGSMVRARPEVAMRSDAWRRVRAILAEFGLTPASRSRIDVNPADDAKDPAEAYF